jgi:hypothetical protein
MQLRGSSSGTADGADQHTQYRREEETPIAPETNSSGEPAPAPEEVCDSSVSNKSLKKKHPRFTAQTDGIPGARTIRLRSVAR